MLSKTTKWIWLNNLPQKNLYIAARGVFNYTSGDASLTIGADTRYQLYVNGVFVGHGPVRSFASNTRLDTYDITPFLRRGKNLVAVQVRFFDRGTFQYINGRGGLIVEVKNKDKVLLATGDKNWKMARNAAYAADVPPISCQQSWVEFFDARQDLTGWMNPEYNDSKWEKPEVVKDGPWTGLSERDIPFLTYKPEYPVRVRSVRSVRPPRHVIGCEIRPYFLPGDKTANRFAHDGIVAVAFRCSRSMNVSVSSIHHNFGIPAIKLDNKLIAEKKLAEGVKLSAGDHIIAFNLYKAKPTDNAGTLHDNGFTAVFDYDKGNITFDDSPISIAALYHDPEIITDNNFFVPFDDSLLFEDWKDVSLEGVKNNKRFIAVKPEDTHRGNPHADTFEARETDAMPKAENINALCTAADDVAVIYPAKDDTEVTLDFGQIRSGFIEFELCAPAGVVIDYSSYEYISVGGEIRRIDAAYPSFRYTAAKGWQRHRSPIRRGTRYGILTFRFPKGAKEPVRIKTFRINESLFPYTHKGKFICSDYVLNDIYRMSLNTIKLCSEDTYVDCPTYEQTFWVGDSRAESLFTYYAFGEYRLAKRCFRLVAESLNRSPIAESQVPSAWQNIIPSFSLLWSMGCYEYYLHSGDRDFLAEMYPAVKKQLDNIDKLFMNKDGLFEIAAWNFLDWTPMDNPDKGVVTHQNILLVRALRKGAECARILGFAKDGKELDKRAENLAKAVNKHLKKGKTYIDSVHEDGVRSKTVSRHNQTLAYLADIIKPGEKEFFENCVEKAPEGFVDVGSPFAMTFVIEALLKASKPEAAIKITRDQWQVMTDNDSGSCWEMFPTHSFSNLESRSFCHAWSATPAFTLPAAVLGVTPIEPGFKKFNVKPCMETLTWAKGIVPTPYGEIVVNVRKLEGNKIAMELTVPEGTTAVAEGKELDAGIYDITLE